MKKRIHSFKYALKGIWIVVSSEINFQIHILAALIVIFLGFYLVLTKIEWILVLLCIALVMVAEVFNTAIEKFVDIISPDFNSKAGKIKDIAAGGVLIAAVFAAIIGFIIFLPKILSLF